jgi:hypothetical protein
MFFSFSDLNSTRLVSPFFIISFISSVDNMAAPGHFSYASTFLSDSFLSKDFPR